MGGVIVCVVCGDDHCLLSAVGVVGFVSDRCTNRSERVDLLFAAGSFSSWSPWRSLSRALGVQPAARLRWNRCLSLGGTLFSAEFLGYWVRGCLFCFVFLTQVASEEGVEFSFISLAIVVHSYVSWVAVQSGALQRGIRVTCF